MDQSKVVSGGGGGNNHKSFKSRKHDFHNCTNNNSTNNDDDEFKEEEKNTQQLDKTMSQCNIGDGDSGGDKNKHFLQSFAADYVTVTETINKRK